MLLVLFILGCGGKPEVTATPTGTPGNELTEARPTPAVTLVSTVIPTRQKAGVTATPILAGVSSVLPQATGTPIILTLNPSNIILELPPTPTPTPTATATPLPPTPTPTPVVLVGTVDVQLTLPIAPNGVSGYIFDVIVGPQVALVGFKTNFSLANMAGNRISAVDLTGVVEAGAVNVTLGTITFAAVSPGAGHIQINVFQLDDDVGNNINARFDPGFIRVR